MKIKTFVFDLGNVLLPFDYSIMIKKLNAISDNLGNTATYVCHSGERECQYNE